MAAHSPILGVGPGNWAVMYPEHAPASDPSMSDIDGGMTTNPWPSSDWVAWVSERGFAATVLMALAFASIALGGVREVRNPERGLGAAALVAVVAGAIVTGLFDAVLLNAVPAFLVWTALGVLTSPPPPVPEGGPEARSTMGAIAFVLVLLIAALGAVRSGAQLAGMQLYADGRPSSAVQIDPGNYRAQLRLARRGKERCRHARAAHALYPSAHAAADASRGCRPE
jgi:hypothetical protein